MGYRALQRSAAGLGPNARSDGVAPVRCDAGKCFFGYWMTLHDGPGWSACALTGQEGAYCAAASFLHSFTPTWGQDWLTIAYMLLSVLLPSVAQSTAAAETTENTVSAAHSTAQHRGVTACTTYMWADLSMKTG